VRGEEGANNSAVFQIRREMRQADATGALATTVHLVHNSKVRPLRVFE
jgi:hypothetical protein